MSTKLIKPYPGGETPLERLIRQVLPPEWERLRTEKQIASGSTGTIEVVLDRSLRHRIARKVLHPELRWDRHAVRAFLREARITAQLEHPGVVPVYSLGETPDRRLYFTMKLVVGESLGGRVRSLPPASSEEELHDLVKIVRRVCQILAYSHERGWIHCDVKPANVMISKLGEVFLMDWGVARRTVSRRVTASKEMLEDSGADETLALEESWEPGALGTPGFMPPEQAVNEAKPDERSDIFMVGSLIYFLLTRRAPFQHRSVSQMLALARACDYPPLEEQTGLAEKLRVIADCAMAPNPRDRYPDVASIERELSALIGRRSVLR